jgi:hypothetical protein
MHEGSLEGDVDHRAVCFAGKGPGEVFVDGRKAVGVTQWRVREGVFLSTVIHAKPSNDVVRFLRHVPDGLVERLDHHVLSTLGIRDPDEFAQLLSVQSGPWLVRNLFLTA